MPTGVYKRIKPDWKKGRTDVVSKETKEKIRRARLGKVTWNKGIPISPEHSKKVSEGLRRYYDKIGRKTPLNMIIRTTKQYYDWRDLIFIRDKYTCQVCGARSGNGCKVCLEAHHIKPFAKYHELRFDESNGVTLCKDCHSESKHKEKWYEQELAGLERLKEYELNMVLKLV